ncbi:MAG: metal-dependent hydrolase [Candidatus Bathyarchaeia archaeon]
MPDVLTHYTASVLIIMVHERPDLSNRKHILMTLFLTPIFGILPDIDFFLGIHREFLHSFFMVLPFLLISVKYCKFFLPSFLYFIHILMDTISGGPILAFWPIINRAINLKIRLTIEEDVEFHIIAGETNLKDTVPGLIFNGLSVSLFLILLIVIIMERRRGFQANYSY